MELGEQGEGQEEWQEVGAEGRAVEQRLFKETGLPTAICLTQQSRTRPEEQRFQWEERSRGSTEWGSLSLRSSWEKGGHMQTTNTTKWQGTAVLSDTKRSMLTVENVERGEVGETTDTHASVYSY